jgi:hypothetical protein
VFFDGAVFISSEEQLSLGIHFIVSTSVGTAKAVTSLIIDDKAILSHLPIHESISTKIRLRQNIQPLLYTLPSRRIVVRSKRFGMKNRRAA